jgi:hypothetical protein
MSTDDAVAFKALIATALLDRSLSVDAARFNLHELTQIAVALRPERVMTVQSAERLSPIEQAAIASASSGQVHFEPSSYL